MKPSVVKVAVGPNRERSLPVKKFEFLSAEEVGMWIAKLDSELKLYVKDFVYHEMDGSILSHLTQPEMDAFFKDELKIWEAGSRFKLVREFLEKIKEAANGDESEQESLLSLEALHDSLHGIFKPERLAELLRRAAKEDYFGTALLGGLRLLNHVRSQLESLKKKRITYDAFLSHDQGDSADLCRSLQTALFNHKVTSWYDMTPGRLNAGGTAEGLARAKNVVVIATFNYFRQKWPVFEILIAEILNKQVVLVMETVKSHSGFDNFKEFRASIPNVFSEFLTYEACEIKRRGWFWEATVSELANRIDPEVYGRVSDHFSDEKPLLPVKAYDNIKKNKMKIEKRIVISEKSFLPVMKIDDTKESLQLTPCDEYRRNKREQEKVITVGGLTTISLASRVRENQHLSRAELERIDALTRIALSTFQSLRLEPPREPPKS